MSPLQDESTAFRQALLKSERLRILFLFIALGMAILARLVRTLVAWNPENALNAFVFQRFNQQVGSFHLISHR